MTDHLNIKVKTHNLARRRHLFLLALIVAVTLIISGCTEGEPVSEATATSSNVNIRDQNTGGIFGNDGLNSFLWRASLDTISFMPVSSADPFGGVIITDWYSDSEAPNERFKLNVYILGRALRADGVRVAVFRQILSSQGGWRDVTINDDTATKIEDSILTRARQLRNEILQAQ